MVAATISMTAAIDNPLTLRCFFLFGRCREKKMMGLGTSNVVALAAKSGQGASRAANTGFAPPPTLNTDNRAAISEIRECQNVAHVFGSPPRSDIACEHISRFIEAGDSVWASTQALLV